LDRIPGGPRGRTRPRARWRGPGRAKWSFRTRRARPKRATKVVVRPPPGRSSAWSERSYIGDITAFGV